MKVSKALLFCPHPDDELTILSSFWKTLTTEVQEVFICYYTNGDYREYEYPKRLMEVINSATIIGVPEDHIIFLGYPEVRSQSHYYYNENGECLYTRGLDTHPEFCFSRDGHHSVCSRKSLLGDIEDCINLIKPEIIISNDYDEHREHRVLSLALDTVIGKLLKDREYTPFVIKRFAYNGSYSSPYDYYTFSPAIFRQSKVERFGGGLSGLGSVYLSENTAIRVPSDKEALTKLIHNNYLYRAGKMHKSQLAEHMVFSIANSDWPFWNRRTDSLTYRADIYATSGDVRYINDFCLFDSNDVLSKETLYNPDAAWRPSSDDVEKTIFFNFNHRVAVKKIVLYESVCKTGKILEIEICCNGGNKYREDISDSSTCVYEISMTDVETENLSIQIVSSKGTNYGLTEIEIYDNDESMYEEVISRWMNRERILPRTRMSVVQDVEHLFLKLSWYLNRIIRKAKRVFLDRIF